MIHLSLIVSLISGNDELSFLFLPFFSFATRFEYGPINERDKQRSTIVNCVCSRTLRLMILISDARCSRTDWGICRALMVFLFFLLKFTASSFLKSPPPWKRNGSCWDVSLGGSPRGAEGLPVCVIQGRRRFSYHHLTVYRIIQRETLRRPSLSLFSRERERQSHRPNYQSIRRHCLVFDGEWWKRTIYRRKSQPLLAILFEYGCLSTSFFLCLTTTKRRTKKRIPFLEMNPKKEKTAERSDEG